MAVTPFFPLPSHVLLLLSCSISFYFYYFRPRAFHFIFCNDPVFFWQCLLSSVSSVNVSFVPRLWSTSNVRQGFPTPAKPFKRRIFFKKMKFRIQHMLDMWLFTFPWRKCHWKVLYPFFKILEHLKIFNRNEGSLYIFVPRVFMHLVNKIAILKHLL